MAQNMLVLVLGTLGIPGFVLAQADSKTLAGVIIGILLMLVADLYGIS